VFHRSPRLTMRTSGGVVRYWTYNQ
jgi:hypothetical protein